MFVLSLNSYLSFCFWQWLITARKVWNLPRILALLAYCLIRRYFYFPPSHLLNSPYAPILLASITIQILSRSLLCLNVSLLRVHWLPGHKDASPLISASAFPTCQFLPSSVPTLLLYWLIVLICLLQFRVLGTPYCVQTLSFRCILTLLPHL